MYKTASEIADSVLVKLAVEEDEVEEFVGRHVAPVVGAGGGYYLGSTKGLGDIAGHAANRQADKLLSLSALGDTVDTADTWKKFEKLNPNFKGVEHLEVPFMGQSAYMPPSSDRVKNDVYGKMIQGGAPVEQAQRISKGHVLLSPNKTDPFILAHEGGHAMGGKFRRALMHNRELLARLSRYGGMGLLADAALRSNPEEGMTMTGYAAPAVAAASPIAQISEEMMANRGAKKLLKETGIPAELLGKKIRAQTLNTLFHRSIPALPVALGTGALAATLAANRWRGEQDEQDSE